MQFEVRALDAKQELIELTVEAQDEGGARAEAHRLGLVVVRLCAQRARGGRVRFPLVLFAQEMHALLVAGLSVIEVLDALVEKEPVALVRDVLTRIATSLRQGLRLSNALAQQPDVFPPLFVGVVQAAEGTSELPRSLARFVDYETRLGAIRQRIVSSSIYPAILVVVGGVVAMFLMGYVVPRFAMVYQSGGRKLPWATQLLLDWGRFVQGHSAELVCASVVIAALVVTWLKAQRRQGAWWQLLSAIPGGRQKVQILEISRLYLTLGMLLEGGLPITTALQIARSALPSARQPAIDEVLRRIGHGEPLSQAFAAADLVTPVAMRLLKVGERSGQMGDMLNRASQFYEGEVGRWIERFTRAFEPVLMVVIGLVVGVIVILLYMPVFDMAGSFP